MHTIKLFGLYKMFGLSVNQEITAVSTFVAVTGAFYFPKDSMKGLLISTCIFVALTGENYGPAALKCFKSEQYGKLASTILVGSLFGSLACFKAFLGGVYLREKLLKKSDVEDYRIPSVLSAAALSAVALYAGAYEAAQFAGR